MIAIVMPGYIQTEYSGRNWVIYGRRGWVVGTGVDYNYFLLYVANDF